MKKIRPKKHKSKKIPKKKRINKTATVNRIREWAQHHPEFDLQRFGDSLIRSDWIKIVKKTAKSCGLEVVYY